jgi:hypothetical protein
MVPEAGLEPAHLAAGDFESLTEMRLGVALLGFFVAKKTLNLGAICLGLVVLRQAFQRTDFSLVAFVR